MRSDNKGKNLPMEIQRKTTGGGLGRSCWGASCPPPLLLSTPSTEVTTKYSKRQVLTWTMQQEGYGGTQGNIGG